jgi:hypothetical protein
MTFDEWLDQGHRCGCNENMRKAWNAALESRVLAERKPIYQVLEPCEASWQDVDWLTYESTDGAFIRIVYDAHPTPDDASVDPFPYQITFDAIAAATSIEAGHISISVRKFKEAFAAIDRARQSGEEGKS